MIHPNRVIQMGELNYQNKAKKEILISVVEKSFIKMLIFQYDGKLKAQFVGFFKHFEFHSKKQE